MGFPSKWEWCWGIWEGGGEGYPPKSESWLNLEMTSHVARLAQILLAPSQHSNYFALTAILTATTTAAAATIEVWPSKGKTTCVANTDVSRKDQQMLEFRLAKKLLKIKMHIIHLPVWILSRNALDTKSRLKKCAIIHYRILYYICSCSLIEKNIFTLLQWSSR